MLDAPEPTIQTYSHLNEPADLRAILSGTAVTQQRIENVLLSVGQEAVTGVLQDLPTIQRAF
jgi:hypothetical protein